MALLEIRRKKTLKNSHSTRSYVRLGVLLSILTCMLFSAAAPKIVLAQNYSSDLAVVAQPSTTEPVGYFFNYTITVENLGPSVVNNVSLRVNAYSNSVNSATGTVPPFNLTVLNGDARNATITRLQPIPFFLGLATSYTYELNISSLEVKSMTPTAPGTNVTGRWVVTLMMESNATEDININMNVFSSDLDWSDPNMSNNGAQAIIHIVVVEYESDLKVIAQPDTTAPADGSNVSYIITVENLGPDNATDVFLRVNAYSNYWGNPFSIISYESDRFPLAIYTMVKEVNAYGLAYWWYDYEFNISSLEVKGPTTSTPPPLTGRWTVEIDFSAKQPVDININMNAFSSNPNWTDPDMSNNQAEAIIHMTAVADLYVGLAATPGPLYPGQTLSYSVSVENLGPSTALNVVVKDWLPAGVSIISMSTPYGQYETGVPGDPLSPTIWGVDSMGPTVTYTMTINVMVLNSTDLSKASWILENDACVSSDTYDPNNANNYAYVQTTVNNSFLQDKADLSVTELVKPDTTLYAGQYINYYIIVENLGPGIAYDVGLRFQIISSAQFTFVGVYGLDGRSWGENGGAKGTVNVAPGPNFYEGDFNLTNPLEPINSTGPLTPSGTFPGRWMIEVTINATQTEDIESIVNVFTRTFSTLDPNLSNNEAQTSIHVTDVADLSLTKTETPNPVVTQNGLWVNYTLKVTNNGPSTAVNVVVVDQLPAILTIYTITVSVGSFCPGVPGDSTQPTTWNVGSLAPGASATMTIDTTIPQAIQPQILWNNAHVTSDTLDLNNANNIASTGTVAAHYSSQLVLAGSVAVSQSLGLPAIELILLASLISAAAAFTVFKRTTVRRFIGLVRTKTLIRTKKE
jgi:uncharacterized repeat protein (TIGR01451 family)